MAKDRRLKAVSDEKRNGCSHHWRIEAPNGPTCRAVCLLCGGERVFQSASENQWVGRAEAETDAA